MNFSSSAASAYENIDPRLLGPTQDTTSTMFVCERTAGSGYFIFTAKPCNQYPFGQVLQFYSMSTGTGGRPKWTSPNISVTPSTYGLYRLEGLEGTANAGLHIVLPSQPTAERDTAYTYAVIGDQSTGSASKRLHQWGTVRASALIRIDRSEAGTPAMIDVREQASGGSGTLPEGCHLLTQSGWSGYDAIDENQTVEGHGIYGPLFLEVGKTCEPVRDPVTGEEKCTGGRGRILLFTYRE